jgi:uncharacterized protein YndB with AHSA1/START domain
LASAGNEHVAFGNYTEFVANRKLVFTWQWQHAPHAASTVTVQLKALGQQTEVTLCHEGLSGKDNQVNRPGITGGSVV